MKKSADLMGWALLHWKNRAPDLSAPIQREGRLSSETRARRAFLQTPIAEIVAHGCPHQRRLRRSRGYLPGLFYEQGLSGSRNAFAGSDTLIVEGCKRPKHEGLRRSNGDRGRTTSFQVRVLSELPELPDMKILKEEINQHATSLLDLAKWKLVTVAAVAVAGLGWSDVKPDSETGLLLLYSVGFVCAYIDTLFYQRNTAIHVLASYLRSYQGKETILIELRSYEEYVNEYRKAKSLLFFSFRWPQFIYSMLFSIGLPILGYLRYSPQPDARLALAAIAILTNVVLYAVYSVHRRELVTKTKELSADKKKLLSRSGDTLTRQR